MKTILKGILRILQGQKKLKEQLDDISETLGVLVDIQTQLLNKE